MRSSSTSLAEREPAALSTANLQNHNDACGNAETDKQTQMKRHIQQETGLDFERGLAKHYEIEQLDTSNPDLAMSRARQAVEEHSVEHSIDLTSRIHGHPPTQSASSIEQFCIVSTAIDPKPDMAHESLEKSGIKPGVLEHAEIRSKAAEEAASFPVNSSSSPISTSGEETATALETDLGIEPGRPAMEVDPDEDEGDMPLARSSMHNIRRGPQQNRYRVQKGLRKRRRSSEEDGEVSKRRRSSSTSMKVNAESRTSSEERVAYECQQTYQQASSHSMRGLGGWISPEREA